MLKSEEFQKPEPTNIVLNENEYLTNFENIIKRYYFPDIYNNTNPDSLSSEFDKLDKINKEYFNTKDNKSKEVDISQLNIDTYCMNYTSDELESLKDIIFDDKRKRLKKIFWMYEQEHNANQKLLALKGYCDEYLKISDVNNNFILE